MVLPGKEEYIPIAQKFAKEEPAFEYEPEGTITQTPLPGVLVYEPAAHNVEDVAPTSEKEPAGETLHDERPVVGP